jgi:hypothetical protein
VSAAVLVAGIPGPSAAAPSRGCPSFESQAAAQEFFLESGGSPRRDAGRLDRDRDGVACEGSPAPYEGFASLGYSRRRHFFYGFATMPAAASGEGGFACLQGNPRSPEGPRWVNVFEVRPGADLPALGRHRGRAAAHPESDRLVWKAARKQVTEGLYYAAFAERQALTPYGKNECPAFVSRPIALG